MLTEGDLHIGENLAREGGIGVYYSRGIMEQTGGTVTVNGAVKIAAGPRVPVLGDNNLSDHNKYAISGLGTRLNANGGIIVGNDAVVDSERWNGIAELEFSSGAQVNGAVSVRNGGKLSGFGRIVGPTSLLGGVISPGNSPGTLTIEGDLFATNNSLFEIEVFVFDPGEYDIINVIGDAIIEDATFNFDFSQFDFGGFDLEYFIGQSFDFFNVTGLTTLGNIDFNLIGTDWDLDIDLLAGRSTIVGINSIDVPEPPVFALLCAGLMFLGFARRRQLQV